MTEVGNGYTGRFAPSPTGPLHFGSLVTAVASYLDARQAGGRWLVRMEDLDPPREQAGAADTILRSLEAHALHWDGEVLYQSQRHDAYSRCLDRLLARRLAYHCQCRRRDIIAMGGVYDGRCRRRTEAFDGATAIRLKVNTGSGEPGPVITFTDLIQGSCSQQLAAAVGDFIIRRKDGLFAYQLAVVVDDIEQGITHIIRGSDLLDSTARQIFLFRLLGQAEPLYGHIAVVVNKRGQKLSKQTGAAALDDSRAGANMGAALRCLNLPPPAELHDAGAAILLQWALQRWRRDGLPAVMATDNPLS